MNRKGLVLSTIIGIILAIIVIVIPTCKITSELFRLSSQASNNFDSFVTDLTELGKLPDQVSASTFLILDKETAVVYFAPKSEKSIVYIDGAAISNFEVDFTNPKSPECFDKGCICLFQKVKYESVGGLSEASTDNIIGRIVLVSPEEYRCKEMTFDLSSSDCGYGETHGINSCSFRSGAVWDRGVVRLAGEKISLKNFYFDTPRRLDFSAQRTTAGIAVKNKGIGTS
ncbi:MAG: hypothetical protein AABX04_00825 [Nanoarchaeota archaeon]